MEAIRVPGRVGFWDIVLVLLGGFGLAIIAAFIVLPFVGGSAFVKAAGIGMADCVGSFWAYQGLCRSRGWPTLQERFSSLPSKIVFGAAACGIALTGLMPITVKGLELAGLPVADPPPGLPIDLPELPLAFLSVVILIPLFEELLFRGLLLNWLQQRMVWWLAALTSSVLFALLHDNGFHNGLSGWLLFGNRVLLALAASFFAVRYRTLCASFVMHATVNSIGVLGTVFLGDSGLAAWV